MKMRIAFLVVLIAAAVTAVATPRAQDEGFPHIDHQRVFPLCTGCHAGVESGVPSDYYPDPVSCTRCHDGVTQDSVQWSGPSREPTNLAFRHVDHRDLAAAAGDSLTCGTCHQLANTQQRMAVGPPRPATCVGCHAHEAPEHLSPEARCRDCHVTLVEATQLTAEQLRGFPQPASHEAADFLITHGTQSPQAMLTCTMCHAQQSCERCHVNAPAVPQIASLGRDERIAVLARERSSEYPTPPSHESAEWRWRHGDVATSSPTTCANCHARPSCQACHGESRLAAISDLPMPSAAGPTGVVIPEDNARVHPTGFASAHGAQAATSAQTCAACHTEQTFCTSCHEGPTSPAFHLGNFRERHGAEAYGGEADCTSCHNTELFCRNCHEASGLGSEGRLDVAFHTAEPTWLLGHGTAARRRLEGCTTCHSQSDCTQCHSAIGAWRINPHGPGFDPSRVQEKNRFTCLRCHRSGSVEP